MKITAPNLGSISYMLETSFMDLGFEMVIPSQTNSYAQQLGEECLKPEICHPLKLLLGNLLSVKDEKPEAIMFYSGCDLCNLSGIATVYQDIFAQNSWYPKMYYLDIRKRHLFIRDFYKNLKSITRASDTKIFKAIMLGYKKYLLFEYLDKVFYVIRPTIQDYNKGENLYSYYFNKIRNSCSFSQYNLLKKELNDIITIYPPNYNLPHIGIIGDPYSVIEPFSHQYTDRKLGYLGAIGDRWTKNSLTLKNKVKNININKVIQNNYGALTSQEIGKLNTYINKNFDGIVFISPFICNPNDALRNQLSVIQEQFNIPILSLVFDAHTCPTGVQTRLEAFIDLVKRKSYFLLPA